MPIEKIQKKLGTYILLKCTKQDFNKKMNEVVEEILITKKFPFSKTFIEMQSEWFPVFLNFIKDKNIKYKNIHIKHNKAFIEF